jgi:hypothetical protein
MSVISFKFSVAICLVTINLCRMRVNVTSTLCHVVKCFLVQGSLLQWSLWVFNSGMHSNFFWDGVTPGMFIGECSTNSVKDRGQNRNLGAVASYSGVPLNLQMHETHIPIRLLWMYIPQNWEFVSALSKLRIFGGEGGFNSPPPPARYATGV